MGEETKEAVEEKKAIPQLDTGEIDAVIEKRAKARAKKEKGSSEYRLVSRQLKRAQRKKRKLLHAHDSRLIKMGLKEKPKED